MFLLTYEAPEGPDNDTEFIGVFDTDADARAFAEGVEAWFMISNGFTYEEDEAFTWDWNPAWGEPGDGSDPGFGSSGSSMAGWRVREVPKL